MYIFLFITLYMFRRHRAHHLKRQIVSIQPLATVTLCWWPCRVQVGSELVGSCIFVLLVLHCKILYFVDRASCNGSW